MKLHEFQAKELFKKHGITVPRSFLVRKLSELKQKKLKGEYAVKAQVLVGGRGKAGGVKFCHATMVPEAAAGMLGNYLKGERVESVLVEEKLDVRREYYLSLAISRSEKSVVFLFSRAGGVDIEELAREQPQEVHRLLLGSFEWARVFSFFLALEKEHANALTEVVEKMHRLMTSKDCELVEINPLVLDARGKFLAADAKVSIDENALYRHPEFE
ncbi:MAG TPA: ATP-grasp domain-containing protein, partial [archaeon]|nr:ATP-grasp domain-containing protein [archaeon]